MNSTTSTYNAFKQIALLVLTPHCFDTYFTDLNFLDKQCFAASLSKGLGIGIILGSVLVKLPQIMKIYNSKTAKGISLTSVSLDLTVISIYASYNYLKQFPLSAWGDTAFLAIQTVAIGFLLLYYDVSVLKAFAYLITYLIFVVILVSGLVSIDVLWTLQGINIPLLLAGRIIQVYANYCNGNTGQLSAVTYALLFLGSLARIFTSVQETGDTMVILTNVFSFLANLVIVGQIAYYWKGEQKIKKIK
ncbi:hypothetical protein HHI36_004738 [Cryptolaemus montrouzieri]|uniref:Mannose-P-dolichol utilization defect 1 protein homolog n=1 Tax=Cryptolaemus montrouzieri TaxID=559131 RepID=A0ABD2NSC9_9CUCU